MHFDICPQCWIKLKSVGELPQPHNSSMPRGRAVSLISILRMFSLVCMIGSGRFQSSDPFNGDVDRFSSIRLNPRVFTQSILHAVKNRP